MPVSFVHESFIDFSPYLGIKFLKFPMVGEFVFEEAETDAIRVVHQNNAIKTEHQYNSNDSLTC